MEIIIFAFFALVVLAIVYLRNQSQRQTQEKSSYYEDDTARYKPKSAVFTRLSDVKSSAEYAMEYGDTDGVITIRPFDVYEIEDERGAVYLRAYCHLRHEERTFRADRIIALRNMKTGKNIDDPERYFYALIPGNDPRDKEHEAVIGRAISGLHPLLWIAIADKEISSDEREILLDFIEKRNVLANKKFGDVAWSRSKASVMLDRGKPTISTAVEFLAKMTPNGREYKLVAAYAEKLASVGGRASEQRKKQLFPNF